MFYGVDESLNRIMLENPIGAWQENNTKQFYKQLKIIMKAEDRTKQEKIECWIIFELFSIEKYNVSFIKLDTY